MVHVTLILQASRRGSAPGYDIQLSAYGMHLVQLSFTSIQYIKSIRQHSVTNEVVRHAYIDRRSIMYHQTESIKSIRTQTKLQAKKL